MFEHVTQSHLDFETIADLPDSRAHLPDNSARRARYARFARSAVRQLPPRQRVVVEMYFDVMPSGRPVTITDIATELRLSASTVSRRLAAARLNLRKYAEMCEKAELFS